ncbi:hypothetical protein MTR67_019610 [Solanum verrucosum]|uniref:TIR domain-containing protein n=1 Tax=Solanum verrucosum TaxID=315347 RepID=A0AAF0QPI7_SOLVR|nr:hypothetical protein MTR67_019610 [Solanum verrucosum]
MQILENCNFGADIGLSVLIDKSLVFISGNNTIEMHDLIQDMGKYAVKKQKDPGERSRLWLTEDFEEVMINNTGTKAVEAIWVPNFNKPRFSKEAMTIMQRLRILCIHDSNCLDGSVEYLPNNLRWFVWNNYPCESLPENFEPQKLVHLDLSLSSLHHLWTGKKHLLFLQKQDLRDSRSLMQTPDFTWMPNLKEKDAAQSETVVEAGVRGEVEVHFPRDLLQFSEVGSKMKQSKMQHNCKLGPWYFENNAGNSAYVAEQLESSPVGLGDKRERREEEEEKGKIKQEDHRGYRQGFRGGDTRRTFTGHFYEGLKNRGIFTFQDDKRLEHGDSISEETLKAIEESQVAEIVFSKNYATSRCCLNELVKIMECKVENGQIVIPVFYDVDPSHVRYQSESFKEAFSKHKSRYKDDVEGMQKVHGWRTALAAAANLKGYDICDGVESESDYIKRIVDQISSKCKTSVSYLQEVVGIDTQLKKVESLLKMEINDVRIVWIWGMGGVGEKDNCVKDKEVGRSMLAERLRFKKILVVLDDIDHRDQLDYLAKDLSWFGKGSRIIATTRDKRLIGENDVVFEVETLLDCDAIKLFNQYAFKEKVPNECFKNLTLEIVSLAKGHPLALKVWGSSLHRMDITEWESALVRIKKKSDVEITKNLKISYDGLEPEEQEIFLDIACFFRGIKKEKVMQVLESCYSGPKIGLRVLVNKSLVSISENNMIEMHDLIQDMGKYIVQMQKHPEERSRLWKVEDFKEVVDNNMGPMAVEAIWFTYSKKPCFSKDAMKNMQRLKILGIFPKDRSYMTPYFNKPDSNCQDGSIEYLSNNLCWFAWIEYPWKLLPESFNPRRLVHGDLRWSSLHYLWNETKQFLSLRRIDLSHSKSLKRTPNFEAMPNLEYLNLTQCTSLEEVHPSLKYCKKLIHLNLYQCESLERFPYVNVESLEYLNLDCCSSLKKFPEFLGIRQLPFSFFAHLNGLKNLVSLPSSICKSKDLVKLDVSRCSKLESLPEEIGDLENLEKLDASYTLISRPPSSVVRLNKLKSLAFRKGKSEDGVYFVFPLVNEGLLSLESLDLSGCNIIDGRLPEDIGSLSSLKELNLSYCNIIDGGLPEDIGSLSSLKHLNLNGNNFEHLPQRISKLGALEYLDLSDCKRLTQLPEDIGCLSSLEELHLSGHNFEHLPQSISELGALRWLELSDCKRLTQLPEFPQQLDTIDVDWSNDLICNSLFQNISSLQHDISVQIPCH